MATDLKVLELATSAKFKAHLRLSSHCFYASEDLPNLAYGSALKMGEADHWHRIELREVARSETMSFLYTTVKDWWKDYLESHRKYLADQSASGMPPSSTNKQPDVIDWSKVDFSKFKVAPGSFFGARMVPAEPSGDVGDLQSYSYPQFEKFARSYTPAGGVVWSGPRTLYHRAAGVALAEMENDAFEFWNYPEFCARIIRVVLNHTPESVLAKMITSDNIDLTDRFIGWKMSLLRDINLDATSDQTRKLINGRFEFEGRGRSQFSKEERGGETHTIEQNAEFEKMTTALAHGASTSALQVDAYCSAAAGTDQSGRAKSLYSLEIKLQADVSNLLNSEDPVWGKLPDGPIGAYARAFAISAWPVEPTGFSLDQSLPAGKDQQAATSTSMGLSGSKAFTDSKSESNSVGGNVGFFGSTPTGGVSYNHTWSTTHSETKSNGWSQNFSVSVPHVDFVNYRIESAEGAVAPLIVFKFKPPYTPDRNSISVVGACKKLVRGRLDNIPTLLKRIDGSAGMDQFLDKARKIKAMKLREPTEASIESFQQTCIFFFSRDDERFGSLWPGMLIPFRIQFIAAIGQSRMDHCVADKKSKDGQENVFFRDFCFDVVVQVPKHSKGS